MIAEYVGTSREIVTANMTGLRRAGLLRYSRKEIEVSTAAMDRALREGGITPNPVETPLVRAASSSGTASLRASSVPAAIIRAQPGPASPACTAPASLRAGKAERF